MLSNLHAWEEIKRNMLLNNKEFSFHQSWAGGELCHLHRTGNRREIEATQLVASEKDAAGWGAKPWRMEPWKWPQEETDKKNYKELWNWRSRRWSSKIHSLQSDKQNHVTRIKDSIKVKRQKERSRTKLWQLIFIHFLYTGSQQHWRSEFKLSQLSRILNERKSQNREFIITLCSISKWTAVIRT